MSANASAVAACGDPMPGCTCGPFWSIVPPGPCPHHSIRSYDFTPIAAAWECPRCKRINAPHASRCDCAPSGAAPLPAPAPLSPQFVPSLPMPEPVPSWPWAVLQPLDYGRLKITSGTTLPIPSGELTWSLASVAAGAPVHIDVNTQCPVALPGVNVWTTACGAV